MNIIKKFLVILIKYIYIYKFLKSNVNKYLEILNYNKFGIYIYIT